MHNLNKLHIHQLARKNILEIYTITQKTTGFADIHNQMQWAALSVVSNIAEGAGMNTNKQFLRFLAYARGSNTELKSQLLVMADLGEISAEYKILDQDGSSGGYVYTADATTPATGDLKSPVAFYVTDCAIENRLSGFSPYLPTPNVEEPFLRKPEFNVFAFKAVL